MSPNATLTAARGTLLSIALRLASFLLSQLTVRFVSAAALGKASIPLELLLSTALFVGREGFRLALTKEIGSDQDAAQNDDVNDDNCNNGGLKNNAKENRQQQQRQRQRDQQQRVTNVSWLSVPTGALLSILAVSMHLYKCRIEDVNIVSDYDDDAQLSQSEHAFASLDYKLAGILYCLASFIESLSEPLVIRCLQRMDVTTKAKAEGIALIMKSVSCFACLYLTRCSWFVNSIISIVTAGAGVGDYYSEENGAPLSSESNFAVTAFGISQLIYALTFTTLMYQKARSSVSGVQWPKKIISPLSPSINNPYREKDVNHATIKEDASSSLSAMAQNFDLHTLYLVFIFTLQGLFKHALTEADKIVLSALAGSYDQGVYALASSYGGLAARFLLQPMEENARLLFSRQGSLVAKYDKSDTGNNAGNDKDDKSDNSDSSNNVFVLLKDLQETYFFLIKVVLYIGLVFAAFGSNYTSLLIQLLAGSRWGSNAEASAALSAFTVYTAFLALNGITEAFVYGVARSGNDVGKLGVAHAIVGGIFSLIAPGLVKSHGAVGLVTANCISMGMRSIYSLHYAHGYFAKLEKRTSMLGFLFGILPNLLVLGFFGVSHVVTRVSRNHIYNAQIASGGSWIIAGAQHIGVGLLCVIVTLTLALWLEKDIRSALVKLLKRKKE